MTREHPETRRRVKNLRGLAGFPYRTGDWPQLTRRLVADLAAWQSFHERHIAGRDRWTGPHHLLTGTRRAARRWFDEEGSRLRRRVQTELGGGYLVDLRL